MHGSGSEDKYSQHTMSEVMRLRIEIEEIWVAMNRALFSYAETAKHTIITHRYSQLGERQEQLERLIGSEQSMETIYEICNVTINEKG